MELAEVQQLQDQVAQICCKLLGNKDETKLGEQRQLLISETKRIIDMFGGEDKVLNTMDVAERQVVEQFAV